MTIKCNTVTQHWAASLPRRATRLSRASSIGVNSRWLAHTLTHSHSHTPIALPKDLTCGLQSTTRSVPTSPASGHQTAGTDGQWSKNEGKQGQPSLACWWVMVLWGEPPNVPRYPPSPLTVPNSGKSNVQFYPARYVPGSTGRNYLTNPSTAARLHQACQPWERALMFNQQDQREC